MSDSSCPKCGFAREPSALDCPVCGIVFSRYRSAPERVTPLAQPSVPAEALARSAETRYEGSAATVNPYAAPRAPVLMPSRAAGEQALAPRGSRLAARILDSIILVAVALPPVMAGGALGGGSPKPGTAMLVLVGLAVIALGGVNLYFLSRDGQTLGKKAVKVRIVMLDGGQARLGRILLLRILAPGLLGAIPIAGPIFGLVDALFIFGVEQRCLHDYMAGTKVVVA